MLRRNHRRQIIQWSATIVMFCVASPLISCTRTKNNLVIMKRVTSPNGRVACVLATNSGGATSQQVIVIHIVPTTENDLDPNNRVCQITHVRNLDVAWKTSGYLVIRYDKAEVTNFSNHWHSPDLDKGKYVVEIRLHPTATRSF